MWRKIPENSTWIKFYITKDLLKKYKGRLMIDNKTRQEDLIEYIEKRVKN